MLHDDEPTELHHHNYWDQTFSDSILDNENCGTYDAVISGDMGTMSNQNFTYVEDVIIFNENLKRANLNQQE